MMILDAGSSTKIDGCCYCCSCYDNKDLYEDDYDEASSELGGDSLSGGAVTVTFIDANHCPGSVMVLLQACHKTYLHTGL